MRRAALTSLVGFMLAGLGVLAGAVPATATVPWAGTSTGTLAFTDVTTTTPLSCASGTQKGVATAFPAGPLNNVTGSTWTTCRLPSGLSEFVAQVGTWTVSGGSVTAISLHVVGTVCTFNLTGSAAATYNNLTHILTYPGTTTTLTSSSVSGCFGLIANGDAWKFTGSYLL